MSVIRDEQEAQLTSDALQERGLIAPQTVNEGLTGRTVRVERQKVSLNGRVVDIEIALVDKVDHAGKGRPVDKQYAMARNSVVARLNLTKWQQATVISCLPIDLRSNSCIDALRTAIVPAVRDGDEYGSLTFRNPHLEPARVGPDAPLSCFDYQPIMLAKEYETVFDSHGGVLAFIGKPEDVKDPNWEHRELWEEKKRRAILWMESMHREARSYWDQKVFYAVREPHRAAIRRLYQLGKLKELPAELDKQRDLAVEYPTCSKCQLRQDSPHTVECTRCHWILDPVKAYEVGVIDENSVHLERLTRATVKEMGISVYVAETVDEKPMRLSMGLPKPLSEAATKLIENKAGLENL